MTESLYETGPDPEDYEVEMSKEMPSMRPVEEGEEKEKKKENGRPRVGETVG